MPGRRGCSVYLALLWLLGGSGSHMQSTPRAAVSEGREAVPSQGTKTRFS